MKLEIQNIIDEINKFLNEKGNKNNSIIINTIIDIIQNMEAKTMHHP